MSYKNMGDEVPKPLRPTCLARKSAPYWITALSFFPPVVGVCSTPVGRNEQVAILQLQSPTLSALRELERTGTTMESNVQLRRVRCTCGDYHMSIMACRELVKGDVLVPVTSGDPQIIVQFDGSARRTSQVGGDRSCLIAI